MDSSEVGPVVIELYNVVVFLYWIDDDNTKNASVYCLEYANKMFDCGWVSMFVDNKHRSDIVVRLCCENKKV